MVQAVRAVALPHEPGSNMDKFFQGYVDAMLAAMDSTLKSIQIVGGTVAGGTAPPSGPVAGATLTAAAPTCTVATIADNYTPPDMFVIMPDGSTNRGSFTALQKAFLEVVDDTLTQATTEWTSMWLVAALPVVVGGVAAWIPPAPPSPPLPGPWSGGTITPFLFDGPAGGTSAAVTPGLVKQLAYTAGQAKTANVHIWQSEYKTCRLISTDTAKRTMDAVMAGFSYMFDNMRLALMVVDKSGAGGSGIAAPGGIITGTMGPLVLDLA